MHRTPVLVNDRIAASHHNMALKFWPQEFSFLQYVRLKATVLFYRSMVVLMDPFMTRRERRLISSEVWQERTQIPSRESNRVISIELYYPPGYSSSSPTPILVTWHGSGWIIPALGLDAYICSRIALKAGIVVVDAGYRMAPENPFPAAIHDVEDVLRWIATQGRFDTQRVAVAGFSAGANFALVAATAIRKKLGHLVHIPLAISVYPETDLTLPEETLKAPRVINKVLPASLLSVMHESYCPDKEARKNPLVSPSFANPTDFPGTTAIITAEGDTFALEAEALAESLEHNGKRVFTQRLMGVAHGFDKSAKEGTLEWSRREELIDLTVDVLQDVGVWKE